MNAPPATRPLLVIADARDASAAAFVEAHHAVGARLVTAADLSRPGWQFRVGQPADSVAVAGGERFRGDGIRAIITRLGGVAPEQLAHVADADRGYVAAEMSAFLLAWLAALECPVLNRPRPPSLAGPAWRWEQWVQQAGRLGMECAPGWRGARCATAAAPYQPSAARAPGSGSSDSLGSLQRFIVVGETVIHSRGPECDDEHVHRIESAPLAAQARRLAAAAGMALLGVHFEGRGAAARLAGVDPWPDLSDPGVAAALCANLH